MPRVPPSITDKIASDAPLRFKDEFCPWVGISPAYGYELVKDDKLKLTKVGKTNYVTSANRRAFIALMTGEDDAAPAAAGSSPIAKPAPAVPTIATSAAAAAPKSPSAAGASPAPPPANPPIRSTRLSRAPD